MDMSALAQATGWEPACSMSGLYRSRCEHLGYMPLLHQAVQQRVLSGVHVLGA